MQSNQSSAAFAPSGLRASPTLPWGSHVGHIFETASELNDVLVPYFKAGLENNESCLWVTGAPFSAAEARTALRAVVVDLDERESRGQIEIQDGDAFYDAGQSFGADELVDGLLKREEAAIAAGFAGLRTNGNCCWVGHEEWPEFRRYEALVQQKVRGRRMICMCSYQPGKLHGTHLGDIIERHDLILGRPESVDDADEGAAAPTPFTPSDFQADITAIENIAAVPILLKIICQTTGMGFAAVARVTGERWVCLEVHDEIDFGLRPGGELKVETTLCHEIWQSKQGIVINHVAEDATYRSHHTPAVYGFQSYISIPIVLRDGSFFGTLCAIDPRPAELNTPHVIGMFRAFADLIAFHLNSGRALASAEASLFDARATAELHDQFVAVLGHDLRNPIAAISAGVRLLEKSPAPEKQALIVDGIGKSAKRMSALVDDIIDLARGRLGVGLSLRRSSDGLDVALRHAIEEIRISHPEQSLEIDLVVNRPVNSDPDYLARVVSNLVTNALKYGAHGRPVRISATTTKEEFVLSVANEGQPIRPEIMKRLFVPFERGDVRPDQQGLGLGLYIVSEIARAHSGTISVTSDVEQTCFEFRMPCG